MAKKKKSLSRKKSGTKKSAARKKKTGKTKKIKARKIQKMRLVYEPLEKLKPWLKNPRVNDEAAEKLAELFAQHGFINPIIATTDGVVRAGHTRLKAAFKTDLKEIPVIYVPFRSEEEAEMYAIADNKSSEWADWDYSTLHEIFTSGKKLNIDQKGQMSGFQRGEIDWQGAPEIDLSEVDEFEVPDRLFVIRIDKIDEGDIKRIHRRVEKALKGTDYASKIH